jgi:hypothetical protein
MSTNTTMKKVLKTTSGNIPRGYIWEGGRAERGGWV